MVNRWLCMIGIHKPAFHEEPEQWLLTKRCAYCGEQLPYSRPLGG